MYIKVFLLLMGLVETKVATVAKEIDSEFMLLGSELQRIGLVDPDSKVQRLLHGLKRKLMTKVVELPVLWPSSRVEVGSGESGKSQMEEMKKGEEMTNQGEAAHESEAEAVLKKPQERMKKNQVIHKPEAVAKQKEHGKARVESRKSEASERQAGMKEREESRKSVATLRQAGMKKQEKVSPVTKPSSVERMKKNQVIHKSEAVAKQKEQGTKERAESRKSEASERQVGMKEREESRKSEASKRQAGMKKQEKVELPVTKPSLVELVKKREERKKWEVARKRCNSKAVYMTQAEKSKLAYDNYCEWRRKRNEENCNLTEELMDLNGFQARMFKERWDETYGALGYGNIDDTTCRFILKSESSTTSYSNVQIISVKVSELTGGLQWPLDVYGLIAVRDSYDFRRNIIFERSRENCQTLTVEDPYLVLTGPMRAVLYLDPVLFEVSLYVRGTGNSEDKELSLLAVRSRFEPDLWAPQLLERSYTSRLSTLDFKVACFFRSVEATISLKVISGPPNGFLGEFAAFTAGIKERVVLHKSGAKEFHLPGDEIHLSRSVLSVGMDKRLKVTVTAFDDGVDASGYVKLDPLEKGTSFADIFVGTMCQLTVSVVWSLFPTLCN